MRPLRNIPAIAAMAALWLSQATGGQPAAAAGYLDCFQNGVPNALCRQKPPAAKEPRRAPNGLRTGVILDYMRAIPDCGRMRSAGQVIRTARFVQRGGETGIERVEFFGKRGADGDTYVLGHDGDLERVRQAALHSLLFKQRSENPEPGQCRKHEEPSEPEIARRELRVQGEPGKISTGEAPATLTEGGRRMSSIEEVIQEIQSKTREADFEEWAPAILMAVYTIGIMGSEKDRENAHLLLDLELGGESLKAAQEKAAGLLGMTPEAGRKIFSPAADHPIRTKADMIQAMRAMQGTLNREGEITVHDAANILKELQNQEEARRLAGGGIAR